MEGCLSTELPSSVLMGCFHFLRTSGKRLSGCPEPEDVMGDQADAYMWAFIQGERYRVAGDKLEIIDERGGTRVVFRRHEPLPGHPMDLSGTAWRLLMEDDGDGDLSASTMVFLNDRLVTGVTACRAYVAAYRTSKAEGSMRLSPWATFGSQQSCSEKPRSLEGEYWEFLWRAWEYSVYDDAESRGGCPFVYYFLMGPEGVSGGFGHSDWDRVRMVLELEPGVPESRADELENQAQQLVYDTMGDDTGITVDVVIGVTWRLTLD